MPPRRFHERERVRLRVRSETIISIQFAASLFSVRPNQVIRWIRRGRCRGLYLDGYWDVVSRQWFTSAEAVERFRKPSASAA